MARHRGKNLGPNITSFVPVDARLQDERELTETVRPTVEEYLSHLSPGKYFQVEDLSLDFDKKCRMSGIKGTSGSFYRWMRAFVLRKTPGLDFKNDGRRLWVAVVPSNRRMASN